MFRYVTGVVFLAAAAALVASALRRRSRALAAGSEAAPKLHPSLELMADIVPPLIIFGLVVAGAQVAFAFWLTGGGGVFSVFDLAGFLLLLVAYGVWIKVKTKHRHLPAAR